MKIPQGSTGFNSEILSMEVIKDIVKKINYPYMPQGNLVEPQVNTNFYRQRIKNLQNGEAYELLINAVYPFVALAKSVEYFAIPFIDFPTDLKSKLSGITILEKSLLEKKISETDLELLAEVEKKQLDYWKPKTISEIIFNFFD